MKHIHPNPKITKFVITTMDGKSVETVLGESGPTLRERLVLQLEMFVYDMRHRTQYRQIRNQLAREKRNREFELKIGLINGNAA